MGSQMIISIDTAIEIICMFSWLMWTPISLNRKLCNLGAVMYAYNFWQKAKQSEVVLSARCVMVKATTKTLKAIKTFW